jgi:hypothetical protein
MAIVLFNKMAGAKFGVSSAKRSILAPDILTIAEAC